MAILTNEVIKFANGNTDFYEAALEYVADRKAGKSVGFEKTSLLDKAYFAEIERKSGVAREGMELNAWVSHPSVKWASFAIIDASINAILPVVVTPDLGLFADLRFAGFGDIIKFRVKPNTLYTVTKGSNGNRTTFRQRKHSADVIISPVEHYVTIYVNLLSVLAGKESIGEFMYNLVLAIEQDMYSEAVDAMVTGINAATSGTDLNESGAFDMKTLLKICEKVQVRNNGVRPIIAGTATALLNVIPNSADGYRLNVDGNGGSIALIRNVLDYDIVRMTQALAKNGQLTLPDNKLFIISPAQDKLIKGAVTSVLSNGNQAFNNADLTEDFTYRKDYDFVYATAATAAVYEITD